MSDTCHQTVVDLVRDMAAGTLTATACLDEHLQRVADSDLNAVVTRNPRARDDAIAADERHRSGQRIGPLHGVPFTVKDTIEVAGLRSTAGSRVLTHHISTRTATAVKRLRQAGAILIGKTNCSEFAVDTHTDNPLFGPTRNPLDRTRTAGGSSGGDSAAVAGGLAAFGIGTDFGGSIRWPAHCTGTAALRATPGLIPFDGLLPFSAVAAPPDPDLLLARLMTVAPLAHTVTDLVLLFSVLAGHRAAPRPPALNLRGAAVAWFADEGTVPVSKTITDTVRNAGAALAEAGAMVRQDRPPGLEECADLFVSIRDGQGLPEVETLVGTDTELLGPAIRDYLGRTARTRHTSDVTRELARVAEIRRTVLRFLNQTPIMLGPVASVTARSPQRQWTSTTGPCRGHSSAPAAARSVCSHSRSSSSPWAPTQTGCRSGSR